MSALMDNPIVKKAFDLYQGGDNVWKIYADDFYQDALGTAFKFNPKNLSQTTVCVKRKFKRMVYNRSKNRSCI